MVANMQYPDCSLPQNWTWAVITKPEGAPHPVVLGYAGDCPECQEGLRRHAEACPLPAEVVPTSDPALSHIQDPSTGSDFCDCHSCEWIRQALQNAPGTPRRVG